MPKKVLPVLPATLRMMPSLEIEEAAPPPPKMPWLLEKPPSLSKRRVPPEGTWKTAPLKRVKELVWPETVVVAAGKLKVRWEREWLPPLTLAPLKSTPPAPIVKVALGVA